jgi:hypothetical protein
VSGDYHNDPNWWATQTQLVIDNIHLKYANERQISLIPVIGGPGGFTCTDATGTVNRATYNFPYINQGISMDLGGDVVAGPQTTVTARSAPSFSDRRFRPKVLDYREHTRRYGNSDLDADANRDTHGNSSRHADCHAAPEHADSDTDRHRVHLWSVASHRCRQFGQLRRWLG